MLGVQGARVLTQDFEGGVGDDVASTATATEEVTGDGDGAGAEAGGDGSQEGAVSPDPTGFGALPSYNAGDSWGAKFSDAHAHVKKALSAATMKANTHAAPRIKAHHGYLHKVGIWGRCVCFGGRSR